MNDDRRRLGNARDQQVIIPSPAPLSEMDEGYLESIEELKHNIASQRASVALRASADVIRQCWHIGKSILGQRELHGWGRKGHRPNLSWRNCSLKVLCAASARARTGTGKCWEIRLARQQCIHTEKCEYFIDLVFYNYILKCFVLIDLKTSKVTHQDVGQMDMYVRMYDELKRTEGDNPTLGILLCADTDEDIARYSVLHGSEQLFAAKYRLCLPTDEQLRAEIEAQKAIRDISKMQTEARYGSHLFENVSRDLRDRFPSISSFSVTNLRYMRYFYELYPDAEMHQQFADASSLAENPQQVADDL